MSLGEYITEERAKKKLSRSELARRVGVTASYMRDIEQDRTVPSPKNLSQIVAVIDLDERMAFEMADKLPPNITKYIKTRYYAGEKIIKKEVKQ